MRFWEIETGREEGARGVAAKLEEIKAKKGDCREAGEGRRLTEDNSISSC
jgi:hypothetical protein